MLLYILILLDAWRFIEPIFCIWMWRCQRQKKKYPSEASAVTFFVGNLIANATPFFYYVLSCNSCLQFLHVIAFYSVVCIVYFDLSCFIFSCFCYVFAIWCLWSVLLFWYALVFFVTHCLWCTLDINNWQVIECAPYGWSNFFRRQK